MKKLAVFLKALRDPFTWNPRRNLYLWFGLLWGLPIPAFSLYLDASLLGGNNRSLLDMLRQHPVHFFALAHPALFGAFFGAIGTIHRDIGRTLEEMARTDPLTGVRNRRSILECLDLALHHAARSCEPVAVVLFDLDSFKEVNDLRGHLAGDDILKSTALALACALRREEALGRYGGDEFLAVVPGDRAAALTLAERGSAAVKELTGLSMSAGVAVRPEDGTSSRSLISAADRALSALKQARYKAHPETRRIPRSPDKS
ncbi:MAG: GGDEF domain-containing protein [Planctomycetes bacterium]|nr:GGDEF domain-containing protein [Planctomycetota bacterium]